MVLPDEQRNCGLIAFLSLNGTYEYHYWLLRDMIGQRQLHSGVDGVYRSNPLGALLSSVPLLNAATSDHKERQTFMGMFWETSRSLHM